MKDLLIVLAITTGIIVGSRLAYHEYERTLALFTEKLDMLENTFTQDISKEELIQEVEKLWLQKESLLIILNDHASMDAIEENLYECFHYYRTGDQNRFTLYKEKTLSGLEDLKKREALLIVDIL